MRPEESVILSTWHLRETNDLTMVIEAAGAAGGAKWCA
jgi:hypothetical protein